MVGAPRRHPVARLLHITIVNTLLVIVMVILVIQGPLPEAGPRDPGMVDTLGIIRDPALLLAPLHDVAME